MSGNLPDGCTDADVERSFRGKYDPYAALKAQRAQLKRLGLCWCCRKPMPSREIGNDYCSKCLAKRSATQ